MVFLPVVDRWVVLTFGNTYHKLKDISYEYDFGIITTLNALDPTKIRSADFLKPENASRRRIQMPSASSLNYFDFQQDENILRNLTGYVKNEYKDLFKSVTGSASFKISTNIPSDEMVDLCEEILNIYKKEDYKESFPGINNITPIKDPSLIERLDNKLLESFHAEGYDLVLAIPEIIDYAFDFKIKFSGVGGIENEYNDVYIGAYRDYLNANNTEIDNVNQFKHHKMKFINLNDSTQKEYNIYKCLLLDCHIEDKFFHLCEGNWYAIETDFIEKISNTLNGNIVDDYQILTDCTVHSECDYNSSIAENNDNVICLDRTYLDANSRVEPCDLITIIDNQVHLIHVKISTRSSSLSHLFNQGVNSAVLLRSDNETVSKLKSLVGDNSSLSDLIDRGSFNVVYGIISRKARDPRENPSTKLPIFSRISLMRAINDLHIMRIPCKIYFIHDEGDRR